MTNSDSIKFNSRGYITPVDAVETDIETFEQVFVFNAHRKLIFNEYLKFLTALNNLELGSFFQWVNGSFTTQKITPNDIDVVTFVNFTHYENVEKILREIRLDFRSRKLIDCYFVVIYPENHPNFSDYRADKLQFFHDFTHDVKREKKLNMKLPKGLISINFNNEG
jgi:hypothetical protein